MKSTSYKLLFIILILIASTSACSRSQNLSVKNAWARPALSGDNGAVYFEIDNPGSSEDAIIGVSSQVAAQTNIHESTMDSAGTISMHPMNSVAIPAQKKVIFEPGGLHVMLVSLNRDLKIGETFQLTLTFEKSGDRTLDVDVKQP
jgi:copper(I)-binding protein